MPSKLHVLHALPPLSPVEPGRMWNTIDDRTRKAHIQQAFRQRFPEPEYKQVNFERVFEKSGSFHGVGCLTEEQGGQAMEAP